MSEVFDLKLKTINARGLRANKTRKFFNWLGSHDGHNSITFVQEAHCDSNVEKKWSKEWSGQMFFSHGTKINVEF